MQTYKMFIGGRWVGGRDTFLSLNPATEQPLGKFQKGTAKDVKDAVNAASGALKKWKNTPAPVRGDVLFRMATLLQKNKESLARLLTTEMGKVLPEARGDVQEAIDAALYFGGEGRRLFGHTTPSELPQKHAMTIRIPLGVVGAITPWNFPIAIPAWKLFAALICGNTIVFKPSSDTPLCATRLVQLLVEAGLPPGVVNMVTGSGEELGSALVTHPDVEGISFTGHVTTGERILQQAGIKKVGLEMGGKNGIIVMPDADLGLAVDGIIWGGFGTTGQRCTAASRVLVHKDIKTKLETALLTRIKKLRLGNGLLATTDVGPLINRAAVEKTHSYTQIGEHEGAHLLTGGAPKPGKGFFYLPTLFTDVAPDMRIAQEEIFGPTVSLITINSLDHAIDVMNNIPYGLSSAIYTCDVQAAFRAMHEIETGITYVNASTIGAEFHLPFGGIKKTGHTREGGILGIDEFSHVKTLYVDYSGKLQRAQIDD